MRLRIPSPAVVIASLALLLSLTGTAVAGALITGAQIQNNTVGSLDLMNNRVKSVDLEDNGIKSIDVMNGQLRAVDFAPGQLQPGPAGPAGAAGPAGPQGAPGLAGVEIVTAESADNSNTHHDVDVTCPAGKRLVGGGAQVYGANAQAALDESLPVDADTWRARGYEVNATAENWHVVAFAICAVAS
jgi:hypothetical protein